MSVSSAGTTNPLCAVFILYNITFNPMPALQKWLEYSVLAATYSCLTTTIGADGLNCRVRNENGCNTVAKPPTHNIRISNVHQRTCSLKTEGDITKDLRDSQNSFWEFCRDISTPRLKRLLAFHLAPVNVVISHDPQMIHNLGVGFPLICFQRLSFPDIATGRCHWRDSPQTRGQFISVLSSLFYPTSIAGLGHFPDFS